MRTKYKVTTHLREEWRWASSPRQAAFLVYREYRRLGLKWSFLDCLDMWTVEAA